MKRGVQTKGLSNADKLFKGSMKKETSNIVKDSKNTTFKTAKKGKK